MTKVLAVFGLVGLMSSSALAYNTCAVVYQGVNYTGKSMAIGNGAQVSNMGDYDLHPYNQGDWNNRISSVYVAPHCHLVGYQYNNFGTEYHTGRAVGSRGVYYSGHYPTIGYMDNLISSVECYCR